MNFAGKRVTVMGLGTFGGQVGAVRFLADEGASEIIVTDLKGPDALADALAEIADAPHVTLRLGRHDEADFTGVDAVLASPAVPWHAPLLERARAAGVPVTAEMNVFIERCAAPIVGVTGSVGKSTTAAMIADVLVAGVKDGSLGRGRSVVHFGGNIGHHALLPRVRRIAPDDFVVLELSSFQLEAVEAIARSPRVAVVTNLAPNHLDRHGTMAEYARCKQNILKFQQPGDVAVLNGEDAGLDAWADVGPADRKVVRYRADDAADLSLQVVGRHNRVNAAAAMAVGRALGVSDSAVAAALAAFRALPHRLEFVREAGGVRYYNDSKATTPEATRTALAAFADQPVIVIVGGYDKKIDLEPLCRELAGRAKAVIAIGQTRATFHELVSRHRPPGGGAKVKMVADLAGAVRLAAHFAAPGDAVLLSPACASYDQFDNYEQRGATFAELATSLA